MNKIWNFVKIGMLVGIISTSFFYSKCYQFIVSFLEINEKYCGCDSLNGDNQGQIRQYSRPRIFFFNRKSKVRVFVYVHTKN